MVGLVVFGTSHAGAGLEVSASRHVGWDFVRALQGALKGCRPVLKCFSARLRNSELSSAPKTLVSCGSGILGLLGLSSSKLLRALDFRTDKGPVRTQAMV